MPLVEVFAGEEDKPAFTAEFDYLPRVGEYLSRDVGGYFIYLNVTEVWHRQDGATAHFKSCLRVRQDD